MKSNYSCFVLLPPKKLTGSQANKKQSNAIIRSVYSYPTKRVISPNAFGESCIPHRYIEQLKRNSRNKRNKVSN